jgi:hypothetical protein
VASPRGNSTGGDFPFQGTGIGAGLHVKCLLLFDFNQNCNMSTDLVELQISNLARIRSAVLVLLRATDGQRYVRKLISAYYSQSLAANAVKMITIKTETLLRSIFYVAVCNDAFCMTGHFTEMRFRLHVKQGRCGTNENSSTSFK